MKTWRQWSLFIVGLRVTKNAPIQLFAELASVEATEDPTPLGEEDGVEAPCIVVLVSYVDSQSPIYGINIDLNAATETDVVGDDVYYSSFPVDYEVDSESDPDADEVPDDINDEGVNKDGNVNASSVGNQIRRIVIHNNPGAHMSRIDPDAAQEAEFPEYPEIPHAYRMGVYSDPDELRVGQRFESRQKAAIGGYELHLCRSRKIRRIVIHNNPGAHMSRIDPDAAQEAEFPEYPEIPHAYRMGVYSDPDELRVGQRFEKGCNWRIRAAFMQKSQMWEIQKFVGPHTCTSTRMTEDHRKLDSKTICTCIMPIVKDMPTIKVSVLIAEIQARFQYRGWIVAMREHVPGTVIESYFLRGNRNVLPIAFDIVDKENMESWEFFLTNLRRSVYCIRHIAANFQRDYKNADWKRQVVRMDLEGVA
ncbi:hypothetical protein GOBAR_DD19643 [Gossypium barbadense]|nr:hypothetical protein GOBAR_DD19643 [Gossypium barbadense]